MQATVQTERYCINHQWNTKCRVFDGGRVMEKHARIAGIVRGRLTVGQEQDSLRHRTVLVARLLCSGGVRTPVHPLYDVTLVASSGESLDPGRFPKARLMLPER